MSSLVNLFQRWKSDGKGEAKVGTNKEGPPKHDKTANMSAEQRTNAWVQENMMSPAVIRASGKHGQGKQSNTGQGKFSDDSAYTSSNDRRASFAMNPASSQPKTGQAPHYKNSFDTAKQSTASSVPSSQHFAFPGGVPACLTSSHSSYGSARASETGSKASAQKGASGETQRASAPASESSTVGTYIPTPGSRDRRSYESVRSGETFGSNRSRRSSFALERASFESNRASLEVFRRASQNPPPPVPEAGGGDIGQLCKALNLPEKLWNKFVALGVIPVDTPVPMSMLRRLWKTTGNEVAERLAQFFAQLGVLKVASLSDNTSWALVQPGHLKALQELQAEQMVPIHAQLIAAYREPGQDSLADVADDGYIMQNVGHHLVNTKALVELRKLLLRPAWLECKLHSYGVASVVSDFRRYLMVEHDDGIKLLLEAFQMSVNASLANPTVSMLQEQLAGRLQLVRQSSRIDLDERPLRLTDQGRQSCTKSLRVCSPSLEQAGGLQRMILRGHTGGVKKVLVSPGGVDAITSSVDGTSRVWDMEIGDCVLLLEGHTGPLTDMAVSTDGSILATSSADGTARIWELEEGGCLGELVGHSGSVNSVAIATNGKIVVTGGEDGTGRVWDLATGACSQLLLGHTSLGALHKVVLTHDGKHAVTCSSDFTARIWEVSSGHCLHTLTGHTGWVVDATLTANSSLLVTGSHDGSARVWNMADGKCLHVLGGHTGRVNAVKLSPNNSFVVTVSDDFTARVFDLQTGYCRHTLEGHGGWVADCAIAAGNEKAVTVSGDDLAVVWDLGSGACQNVLEGHSDEVVTLELTRKGRFAVTGSMDGTARIWDLHAQSTHLQKTHTGRVHGLVATPGSSTIISYGDDGCLVWDLTSRRSSAALEGPAVRWALCTEDGSKLLTASADRTTKLWDLKGQTAEVALPGSSGSRVKSWAASQDGKTAVVVLFDSTVTVWDLATQQPLNVLQRWGQRDEASGHSGGVNHAAISHDGRTVITVSKDCTARVWDARQGQTVHVLRGHSDGVTGACISAGDSMALTFGYDTTARLWNLESGACLGILQHASDVTRAVFSPDGSQILTASDDHAVLLWQCDQDQKPVLRHTLKGHTEEVMGAMFSPDGRLAATCARDNSLRLWNASTGFMEGFFASDAGLTCCIFAGGLLVAGDDSGTVHFLALQQES